MKYFRNKEEIEGIEPDALWKLTDLGNFELVDDDQYFIVDKSFSDLFYQVENPFPDQT